MDVKKYFVDVRHDFYEYYGRLPNANGGVDLAKEFLAKNPSTDLQVREFYRECNYIDDLAYWHIKQKKYIQSQKLLKILLFLKDKFLFKNILEIGAGIGTESVICSYFFDHVISVEPNVRNVDFFMFRLNKHGISNVEIICGNDSNIGKVKTDICFFMDVIEHVKDADCFINNVIEKTDSNVFIFNNFGAHRKEALQDPYHFNHNRNTLYKLFEKFGYRKVKVHLYFPPVVFIKNTYDLNGIEFHNCK